MIIDFNYLHVEIDSSSSLGHRNNVETANSLLRKKIDCYCFRKQNSGKKNQSNYLMKNGRADQNFHALRAFKIT